jgi:hypothetical protein
MVNFGIIFSGSEINENNEVETGSQKDRKSIKSERWDNLYSSLSFGEGRGEVIFYTL